MGVFLLLEAAAGIGHFGYNLLDNIFLFSNLKIISTDPEVIYTLSQKFWLFGLLSSVIKNFRKRKQTQKLLA